jgi:hypothetical protein
MDQEIINSYNKIKNLNVSRETLAKKKPKILK